VDCGAASFPLTSQSVASFHRTVFEALATLGIKVSIANPRPFDLPDAHRRFSDRHLDQPPEIDPVTREAYSREVISFGFWFGDDSFPEPAFYAYTAPEPTGLAGQPL
jgi:hypothetical protein